MEIYDRLDEVVDLVESSKMVPLSVSCIVPRDDLLDLIEDVRRAMPEVVREADYVIRQRNDVIDDATHESETMMENARRAAAQVRAEADDYADQTRKDARRQADGIVAEAQSHAHQLISSHAIVTAARDEAARIIAEAHAEARRTMNHAYSQASEALARAETTLSQSLNDVTRQRQKIQHSHADARIPLPTDVPTSIDAPRPNRPVGGYQPVAASAEFFDLESAGGWNSS